MSRHGYSDDGGGEWALICWRGAVNSAIRGKRGQAFLKEALAALDALPVKELVSHELEADGSFCTLGAVAHARGVDVSDITYDRYEEEMGSAIAPRLDIANALAREIMYLNDEESCYWAKGDDPARRFRYMRDWIVTHIKKDNPYTG
jgi:hypothetical protein